MTAELKSTKVTFPWARKDWAATKQSVLAPITAIAGLDAVMCKTNGLKPRVVSTLVDLHLANVTGDGDVAPARDRFLAMIAGMQELLKRAPTIFRGREFYTLVSADNLHMTREQAACILVCMWFDLFNFRYIADAAEFPEPTLNAVWTTNNLFALQCLCGYFDEILSNMSTDRIVILRSTAAKPDLANCPNPVPLIRVVSDRGQSPARCEIVSSYDFIGGDMFASGTTMVNLPLLTHPETMIMTVFVSRLHANDAAVCVGARKYSLHRGNGAGASYSGAGDLSSRAMIFVDADDHTTAAAQFITYWQPDLAKLHAGMAALPLSDCRVLGGGWVNKMCGNPYVKFIQHALTAGMLDLDLDYLVEGRDFEDAADEFANWLHDSGVTVAGLCRLYLTVCRDNVSLRLNDINIFTAIMDLEI